MGCVETWALRSLSLDFAETSFPICGRVRFLAQRRQLTDGQGTPLTTLTEKASVHEVIGITLMKF